METKTEIPKTAPGAERQPSKIYAIKSFKASTDKLLKTGLITVQEHTELKKLTHKMTEKYMNEN